MGANGDRGQMEKNLVPVKDTGVQSLWLEVNSMIGAEPK